MSLGTSPAAALRSERGNFMVQAMLGSIISLVAIGTIAAGITGITQFQVKQQLRAEATTQAVLTDTTFRNDVLWAAAVRPIDDRHVEFTVPGPTRGCETAAWSIEDDGEHTRILVKNTSYPGIDTSAVPARCTGEASEPVSAVLVDDAAPGSTFTYANAAGRALSFEAGAWTGFGDSVKPESTGTAGWESKAPAAAALETEIKSSTTLRRHYRFAQTADNLPISAASLKPDAAVHPVPDGDLR
ncbi:hypothetical protein [Arthrobacter caoxuetaonis]|uniref:Uncharacterized protein n=1 Tax=Arthrobacter caoxuetaonis TaxID=2886935 RepID=A0A9X1MIC3_9MICC|nr:hypothetical protein [Arthrobacter caoxuetaonis]MCC3299825.1 hypothetical protein [Arthrobacter caoxuetaonis]USQ59275.1 hypothetical protein NF551_16965 [Arthrobacter caoxuetaonis]